MTRKYRKCVGMMILNSNNEILVHMHRDMPWVFYDKHDDVSVYMYDNPNLRIVKVEKVLAPNLSKDQIFNTNKDIFRIS